jgi:hypothetical protein
VAEVTKALSQYLATIGRRGGKKRAEKMTEERRRELAEQAAKRRWSLEKRCRDKVKQYRCLLEKSHAGPHRYTTDDCA